MARTNDTNPLTGLLLCVMVAIVSLSASQVHADGTETLGEPSLTLAAGTDLLGAGVGLLSGPGTIELNVPEDASIKQVLLYWNGFHTSAPAGADETATVAGVNVLGTPIADPTYFYTRNNIDAYCSTYRADITTLGLVSSGSNSIALSGVNFDLGNNGASILVVVDDGSPLRELQLRDGQDLAYLNFGGLLQSTVAQTFELEPSYLARTADLHIVVGSVAGDMSGPGLYRPNLIRITYDNGVVQEEANRLASDAGYEWDHAIVEANIPARATSMTVEVLSLDDGSGNLPASLAWSAAALSTRAVIQDDFVRGDANDDGGVNIADVVTICNVAVGMRTIDCMAAGDVNDDFRVNLVDAMALADYLFTEGPPPPSPFEQCGQGKECTDYNNCP